MKTLRRKKIKPGIYLHFKGGKYLVLGTVYHSETLEPLVLYQHLDKKDLWVRPYKMFNEKVSVNGKKVSRFTFIGGPSKKKR